MLILKIPEQEYFNNDTGEFTKAGLQEVNWTLVGIVSAVCLIGAVSLLIVRHNLKTAKKTDSV